MPTNRHMTYSDRQADASREKNQQELAEKFAAAAKAKIAKKKTAKSKKK